MNRKDTLLFRKLSYEEQELFLQRQLEGRFIEVKDIVKKYKEHKRDKEVSIDSTEKEFGSEAFILMTKSDKVKKAYQKMIAGKPETPIMTWISMKDKEPNPSDLPFVTNEGRNYELWEDSDWFQELTEKNRLMWDFWMPLKKP